MSSKGATDDELDRLLAGVLTDTTLGRATRRGGTDQPNVEGPTVSQEDETGNYRARVNRLTFADTGINTGNETGTSTQRRVDSLFIDTTSSGVESSEGGAMLLARSSGNSTIKSVVDVTPLSYEIYQFPRSLKDLEAICCQRQRGGVNACIRLNCKLNHQGPRIVFEPGCIVITRSSGSVFIEPKTSEENIDASLLSQWKKFPQSLGLWREVFEAVNTRQPGEPPFTGDQLVERRAFTRFAKSQVKSPSGKLHRPTIPNAFSFAGEKSKMFLTLVEEAAELETQRLSDEHIVNSSFESENDPGTPTPLLRTGEWSYGEAFNRLEVKVDVSSSIVTKLTGKLDE